MNPYVIYCTNYVDKRIYTIIFKAAEIKYTALYKMAIQAFQGKVIRSEAFWVIIKTV